MADNEFSLDDTTPINPEMGSGSGSLTPPPAGAHFRDRLILKGIDPDKPIDFQNNFLDQARLDLPAKVTAFLVDLNDTEKAISERLEVASQLSSLLTPILILEGLQQLPNPDRSIALSRALASVRDMVTILSKKRDYELEDNLNPHSPKFAAAFGWFFDMFYEVLDGQGLEEIQINNIFESMSTNLVGWEDKLEKRLKGVAGRNLDSVRSPFIKNWQEEIPKKPAVVDPAVAVLPAPILAPATETPDEKDGGGPAVGT